MSYADGVVARKYRQHANVKLAIGLLQDTFFLISLIDSYHGSSS